MKITLTAFMSIFLMLLISCRENKKNEEASSTPPSDSIRFMTLDPGHFHAALVQKEMYNNVSSRVYVYAPGGPELREHLALIQRYNTRQENPTHWDEYVYTGSDYLEKMLKEKPGNVVIIAGNNSKKTEYIYKSIDAGINVLSDKPMVIFPEEFSLLKDAFQKAKEKKVLLYDIMTERFEITNTLQKELAAIPEVFGTLQKGSAEDPAITEESIHNFYKNVSGKPLIRPAWYFDINQQGEGIVDVTTHLIDLVQWECFPGKIIDYTRDISMISAKRWTTDLSLGQFTAVTGLEQYPDFLNKYLDKNVLKVYCNGEIEYKINGTYARVTETWEYQAPAGAGDMHNSVIKGTKSDLIIRQGKEENYQPTLYVKSVEANNHLEAPLEKAVKVTLQEKYPGISLQKIKEGEWKILIPEKYDVGHEAHFAQVVHNYLHYLQYGDMPDWEVPGMLAKYYITTQALILARSAK